MKHKGNFQLHNSTTLPQISHHKQKDSICLINSITQVFISGYPQKMVVEAKNL